MLTTATALVFAAAVLGTQATAEPPHIAARAARADTGKTPGDKQRERVLCVQQVEGATVVVPVHPSIRTRWRLLDQLVSFDLGIAADYSKPQIDEPQRKRFRIQPLENASATNLALETSVTMTYLLVPVGSPEKAVSLVIVQRKDPITGELRPPAKCDANDSEADPNTRLLGGKLVEKEVLPGITSYFRSDAHELRLQTGPRSIGKPGMWFNFVVTNIGNQNFPPTGFAMSDGHTNAEYLVTWLLADGTQNLPDTLAPGETLSGAVLARNAAQLRKGFELRMLGPPAVGAAQFGWGQEPEPEPANKGRLSVQVQGLGGAINIKESVDSSSGDYTVLGGLGVRAAYGFFENLSVEGSLSVLSTGAARFDTGTTVDATTTRAVIGGLLHGGQRYVPYARVGLGLRISNYATTSTTGDSDSQIRASAVLDVGAGFDIWLGKSFIVGVAAGYVGPIGGGDDDSFSIEASAHAGYAWKP